MGLSFTDRDRRRLGIALGPTRLWAVALDRPAGAAGVFTTALQTGADGWVDLPEALGTLAQALGVRRAHVSVALLPALAPTRHLELPRLSDDEMRQVLSRDAARYFVGVIGSQTASALPLDPGRRSPERVFATTVSDRVLEQLDAAVSRLGWTIDAVVPAHAAWAAAIDVAPRPLAARAGALWLAVETAGDRLDLLRVERGRVRALRRGAIPSTPEAGEQLWAGAEVPPGAKVILLANPEQREALQQWIRESGRRDATPNGDAFSSETTPEVIAARFAARARGPVVLPGRVMAARRQAARRRTRGFLAASALWVALAAGAELWRVQRELDAVTAQRRVIAANVQRAMALRDDLGSVEGRVVALRAVEASAPRWSQTLATVAMRLPQDAHLTAFRGAADTLRLEGQAAHASEVFAALRRTPAFAGVRAEAPIQQEHQESLPPVERFTLSAIVTAAPTNSAAMEAEDRP